MPRCIALALALGAGAAVWLVLDPTGPTGTGVFLAHVAFPVAGLPALRAAGRGRGVVLSLGAGALSLLAGAALWLPVGDARPALGVVHAALGFTAAAGGLVLVGPRALDFLAGRRLLAGAAVCVAAAGPAAAWGVLTAGRAAPHLPAYAPEACWRFLTATTVEQAGEPGFPSALRVAGDPADCSRCHAAEHAEVATHAHGGSGANPLYRRALAGYETRRGAGAGRWCQGCHSPASLRSPTGEGTGGVDCLACHAAGAVRALTGSAPLSLGGGAGGAAWEVALRPQAHARANTPPLLRAAELCAGCHRKHYGLPQTEFRWLPALDPYREWLESAAGGSVFARAIGEPRGCGGCHTAHEKDPYRPAVRPFLFVRRRGAPEPPAALAQARPGEALHLDVVLANPAGHGFPAWMPDLHDARLVVEVRAAGGTLFRSAPDATLTYALDARDAAGESVPHGELDRAVRVTPARRIPAGSADVARYALTVPAGGIAAVRVAVLRVSRARPETLPAVIGTARWDPGGPGEATPAAWLAYGRALTGARSYPEALQALRAAQAAAPRDPEVHLALGRLFLEEGDRLAAREAFQEAAAGAPVAAQAWGAVVLRRSGQPEEAVRLLRPLVRHAPRDPRLRFELGRAYMDLLRHADAAAEFRALLDADPLDPAGHYNLRLCLLRLNRFAEARREEALYSLLAGAGEPGAPAVPGPRPLAVYPLLRAP